MTCSVLIVGLPAAATCPPEKTWRAAGELVTQRLHARFGEDVAVAYVDLFSPEMGGHPDVEARIATDGLVPPVVVVDGSVLSGGRQAQHLRDRACGRGRPRGVATHG